MRLFLPTLSLLPFTFLLSSTVVAAPDVDSLQEAVQQAVTENPEVGVSWHDFQAAMDEVDMARGGYFPSVDINAGVGREYRDRDDRDTYNSSFSEISLTQMLWDGFATASEVKRLDSAKLVSYYELMRTSNEVALDVVRAYQDVRRYRALVRLAKENYAKHLRVYDRIEQRARSGAGRRVDLEQIDGRLALAESNLLTEATNLHDVSARFQRLVGVLPADTLAPIPDFDARLPESIDSAARAAFEGNPGFHAAIENIEAARAEARGTRAAFHPQLDFRARTGTNNEDGVNGRYDEGAVEIVASMNLYRGGSDLASYRRTSDLVNRAKSLRDKECVDLRQTTTIAYNDARRITEQLDYLNQHRLSIGRVRGAYQQQFDIGQRTLLDVLDSENEYFQASRAYANADFDLSLAQARILTAMGQLLPALDVSRGGVPTLAELGSDGVAIEADAICPTSAPSSDSLDTLISDLRSSQRFDR
ncbi:TolC family outer membrane protein [Halomonas sp. M20]|uniref:TolC family outer membrane protein n=1 Tax=Halomonas sp. M20 TaxID=2763264 RepID=UPI001D0A0FED|nr:TolC family outer membrane protein [Halomonas sp. M20]